MKLETEVVVTQESAGPTGDIQLPAGLIGLPELKRFELLHSDEIWPLMWLRVLGGDKRMSFLVVQPNGLIPDYQLEIGDEDASALGLKSQEDAFILNIVTVRSVEPQEAVVNLVGPIVINKRTLIGRQVILSNYDRYSAAHPLIREKQ